MKSEMVVPTQPVVEVVARVCRESPEKESLAGGEHKQDGKMVDYVLPGRGVSNKTIGDEGITVDFRFIKVHTSN